jgi:LuxR family maltose regulon positive regulatory protein
MLGGIEGRWEQTREQKKGYMPRSSLHALIWSQDQALYELFTRGDLKQRFRPEDEKLWLDWLHYATSFAFQGSSGRLNVYKETRRRGGHYWYAYHTAGSRTHKRYLGQTINLTFACLEETAKALANTLSSVPLATMPPSQQPEAASHGIVFNTPRGAEQRAELLATKFAFPRCPLRSWSVSAC